MNPYFDTGVLLKLYTAEPESPRVQAFVRRRAQAIRITDLHRVECVSAFRLKEFRGECAAEESSRALGLIAADLRSGVLRIVALDWNAVWQECRVLAETHAAKTGCRTLDTLHVASALRLGARDLVTSDRRQAVLAQKVGLHPMDPTLG